MKSFRMRRALDDALCSNFTDKVFLLPNVYLRLFRRRMLAQQLGDFVHIYDKVKLSSLLFFTSEISVGSTDAKCENCLCEGYTAY